jgi:deoxyribonuclease IV
MRFGLHVSIAGKIHQSLDRAHQMGCEAMQIFVGNPRGWKRTEYQSEDLAEFRRKRAQLGIDPVVVHASYLINLASTNSVFRHSSADKLLETLENGAAIEASDVVLHIGSHQGDGVETGFERLRSAISLCLGATSGPRIALEPSAGGGHHIGWQFEELAQLLDLLGNPDRLSVALDTAHLWASGWDVKSPEGFDAMLREFDKTVGLSRLSVLHLNDSKAELGSKRDRHDNIGEGSLGLEAFRHIVHHADLQHLPAIMETPGFDTPESNGKNIEVMKALRDS